MMDHSLISWQLPAAAFCPLPIRNHVTPFSAGICLFVDMATRIHPMGALPAILFRTDITTNANAIAKQPAAGGVDIQQGPILRLILPNHPKHSLSFMIYAENNISDPCATIVSASTSANPDNLVCFTQIIRLCAPPFPGRETTFSSPTQTS